MNTYPLSSLISLLLSGMGLSAFIVGIVNYKENRESKTSVQMLLLLICTFFWDFGYAWMGMCFDSDLAYFARAIALLAISFYLFFLVRYIAVFVHYPEKKIVWYHCLYWIANAFFWPQIILKTAVDFETTYWGYWYYSHMSVARTVQFITSGVATVVFYYIVIYGLKRAKLKREKYILKKYLLFGPIFYLGYAADTILPTLFKLPAMPGSAISVFFATLFLFRISKENKAFGISKDNISEYVFQDVNTPVIITDHKHRIDLYNDKVLEFFGCEREMLKETSLLSFFDELKIERSGEYSIGDEDEIIVMHHLSRGLVEFKLARTDVNDKFGDLMYTIFFVQDMTKERESFRKVEESMKLAEDANMAKSNFLANMSHEIRTPMNAIIGMSEIIMLNYPDNEAKSEVMEIKNAANNLLGIINDILDISKIEAGKYEIISDDYKMSSLINDVSTVIRVRLQETKTKFILELDESVPENLYGDITRIRQILLNLLGNAVKFTKEGNVTLKVFWNNDKNDTKIYFDIKDTGIGIKAKDLDHIFGAFNQVDTRRNRSIQGTGLGLAISKQLAQLMDGDVSVESVYGEGSTFHLVINQTIKEYLPIGEKTANVLIEGRYNDHESLEKNDEFVRPNAKVLVVDDVDMNLIIAQGLLKKYEIDADIAMSGKEAIEMVKEKDYDLIFMDHMMPGLDGIDTTKAIRNLGDKYKDITIVALTANAINEAKELFFNEGMQDFLAKPIEQKKLDEIIQKWL